MNIIPPFGYGEIVPLHKDQKVMLPAPGQVPDFAKNMNAIPVSYTEFALAGRDYPIVFASSDNGKTFSPMAVLGITAGENLYLDSDEGWDKSVYVPAYVRRYPFCMARVTLDSVEQDERLVCVEKRFLSDNGEALFDAKGEPGAAWQGMEKLLNEYEADLERSREMCGILADFGLLESFTMQAVLTRGGTMNLTGMYRVEEKKLEFLNASQCKNLLTKGVMGRIYAHLLSMDNFMRLLDRKSARTSVAEKPATPRGSTKKK